MSDPPEAQAVSFWIAKAEAALASARAEQGAGRDDFAVNRAYYAAFYAASAALLKRGHRFSKHVGLRSAVHRELVRAGVIEARWGKAFDRLFDSRQRADYLTFASFDPEETRALLADAEGLVAELRRLIEA